MLKIKSSFPIYDDCGDLGLFYSNDHLELFGCRESFHDEYGPGNTQAKFVAELSPRIVKAAEHRLKLKKKQKAKFGPTDKRGWIEVTPNWWLRDANTFSLFTILLRAGRKYRSLRAALAKEPYLKDTATAVKSFLSGRTNFICELDNYDFEGWREEHYKNECSDLLFVSDKEQAKLKKVKATERFKQIVSLLEHDEYKYADAIAFALCKKK